MSDTGQTGQTTYALSSAEKIEAIHRDVVLANSYRLEFIKHGMSLAGAVFVFTVTFIKDMIPAGAIADKRWIALGWGALIVSLLAGLGHLHAWERYYISYRDHSSNQEDGKKVRKKVNRWRLLALWLQVLGFLIGLSAIGYFCYRNLK